MKKLLLAALFSLFMASGFACDPTGWLHVRLYNYQPFTLVVNGKLYPSPSNDFNVSFLPGPQHIAIRTVSGIIIAQGIFDILPATELYAIADPFYGFRIVERKERACNSACNNQEVPVRTAFLYTTNFVERTPSVPDKLIIIKRFIAGNPVDVSMVAIFMDLLAAEKHKLDIAKFAYPYVKDSGSYFLVREALVLESTKKELDDWIGRATTYQNESTDRKF